MPYFRQSIAIIPILLAGCAPATDDAQTTTEATTSCNPAATPFGGGTGTAADPLLVCSVDQLVHIGDSPYPQHFRIERDLDLGEKPVRGISRFVGSLDGAGHTLSGLVVDGTSKQGALIREQRGAIANLHVKKFSVHGAALLTETNWGVIRASSFEGDVTTGGSSTGGVAATNNGLVIDVSVVANVAGGSSVGGVVGSNGAVGRVVHTTFEGNVSGGGLFAGGISGVNEGLVADVRAKGTVKMPPGVGRGAGGITVGSPEAASSTSRSPTSRRTPRTAPAASSAARAAGSSCARTRADRCARTTTQAASSASSSSVRRSTTSTRRATSA